MYTRRTTSRPPVAGVYVNDLLITGVINANINWFKQEMKDCFRKSDLGLLTYYCGIEVCQDSSKFFLCQKSFAKRLLEKVGMADCNPCQSPMETRLKLIKGCTEARVDTTQFRSVVDALRYLIHMRTDLAHSVNYVSRFMSKPHEDHQARVKRILKYVASTQDHDIRFVRGGAGELLLHGYSDSDKGGDIEESKSTSGILFYLGKNPITW
jgi:hypothetical protein